jgi:nitrogen fixation NifU-like protein
MADLKDLYQDILLDHYRKPRNYGEPDRANRQADGFNPLCGDKFTVYVRVENGIIRDIGFVGSGCAVSIASASMMTESLKGKSEVEAGAAFDRFRQLTAGSRESRLDPATMGELAVFEGLRHYPVRVKCATLPWQTMHAALHGLRETAVTE